MLIIFDLDDTLIDTQGSIVPRKLYLVLEALQKKGFFLKNLEEEYFELLKIDQSSASSKESVNLFLKSKEAPRNFFDLAEKILEAPLPKKFLVLARESALEILKKLRKNHQVALVTQGNPKLQMQKLRKAGIDYRLFHIIQVILTGDKGAAYQNILNHCPKMIPADVVVLGDRVSKDLMPAKKLGMTTVHMCYGRGSQRVKSHPDVDFEVDNLLEFFEWTQQKK